MLWWGWLGFNAGSVNSFVETPSVAAKVSKGVGLDGEGSARRPGARVFALECVPIARGRERVP